jgi:Family of unknown function (DUF6011)
MTQVADLWDGLDDDLNAGHEDHQDMRGKFTNALDARAFLRAGKATVTLVSLRTGTRFTYRVNIPRDQNTGELVTDGTLMVGVLTGPDNNSSYQWLGRVSRDIFWVGRKNPRPGEISKDAPSARAFQFAWQQLLRNQIPAELEIWHEGRCGRCGRRLTVPESIAQGFGPECINHVHG